MSDVSVENRQTNIAEKLSELYDNEYTDAFDVLEKQNKGDMEIIDLLRTSLMVGVSFSSMIFRINLFLKCKIYNMKCLIASTFQNDRIISLQRLK